MPTLGEELKRLREERNIPLAEISEATRIGTRFLKAIENDNFSILPGGIFTRSFIRAYAKQVGMDEDEAVIRYQQQASGSAVTETPTVTPPVEEISPPPPKKKAESAPLPPAPIATPIPRRVSPSPVRVSGAPRNWAKVIIGLAIVVFIGAVIITLVRQLNSGTATEQAAASSRNAAQPPSPPPPVVQQTPPSSETTTPTPGAAVAETSRTTPQGASGTTEVGPKLVVKLEASSGDSWIKYQVDDANPTQMILKQGQTQEIPAALNQIKLNYGNRETLKLTINNRQASFPPDTPKFRAQVVISRDTLQSFFQ